MLFSESRLSNTFSEYLGQLASFEQQKLNLARVKDLFENAAATDKEYEEAGLALKIQQAHMIQSEADFLSSGLDPMDFMNHDVGTVWVIGHIHEEHYLQLKLGSRCEVEFPSIKTNVKDALVEKIGDVMEEQSHTLKLRIGLRQRDEKIKAGMRANLFAGHTYTEEIRIPTSAISKFAGKKYAFV